MSVGLAEILGPRFAARHDGLRRLLSAVPMAFVLRLSVFAVLVLAALWWRSNFLNIAEVAPQFHGLDNLTVVVPRGGERTIGQAELLQVPGAQSASIDHLRIFDDGGGLALQRITERRRLFLNFGEDRAGLYSDAFVLDRSGATITELAAGAQTVRIAAIQGTRDFALRIDRGAEPPLALRLGPDGRLARADGKPVERCYRVTGWDFGDILERVSDLYERIERRIWGWSEKVALLGGMPRGQMPCVHPNGLAQIPMSLADQSTEVLLEIKNDTAVPEAEEGGGSGQELRRATLRPRQLVASDPVGYVRIDSASGAALEQSGAFGLIWPVATDTTDGPSHVETIIVGRTSYDIDVVTGPQDWTVILTPRSDIPLFVEADCFGAAPARPPSAEDRLESCPPDWRQLHSPAPAAGSLDVSRVAAPPPLARAFVSAETASVGKTELLARWGALAGVLALVVLFWPRALTRGQRLRVVSVLGLALVLFLAPEVAAMPQWLSSAGLVGYMPWVPDEPALPQLLLDAMIALWVLAGAALVFDRTGGWLLPAMWVLLAGIVMIGALSLFALSVEGPNTDWDRFFVKHKFFVLDILPLLAIGVVLTSPERFRTYIGNDFAGRPQLASSFVLLTTLTVVFFFMLWLVLGKQEGLGPFQPVEAGKFAVIVALGTVLAQIVIRMRIVSSRWFRATKIATVTLLIVPPVIIMVPVLRSDYSPAIIVLCTGILTGWLAFTLALSRMKEESDATFRAIADVPIAFLPRIRKVRTWRTRQLLSTVFVVFCLALAPAAYFFSAVPVSMLGVKGWSWKDSPEVQISLIDDALGERRRVPLERLISWSDLRYWELEDAVGASGPAGVTSTLADSVDGSSDAPIFRTIEFRDLGYQVMRSRAALAAAPQQMAPELACPGARAASDHAAWLLARLLPERDGCDDLASVRVSFAERLCDPSSLQTAVRLHCIPVIQSDFAASFLVARFGQQTARLLLLLQGGFVLVALLVFLRLQRRQSGDPVETGANQALAVIALGSGSLYFFQWLLAWANAFGVLPVMGQPMTWLSAATSHHLFAAIPTALALIVAIRVSGVDRPRLEFDAPPKLHR